MIASLLLLIISGTFLSRVEALTCYTCTNEKYNSGTPCTNSMVKCQPYQDTCATFVSFHALPEQYGHADRTHHISKGCDSTQGCFYRGRIQNENCIRRNDRDWACLDCCSGDLCNYHVKLSSSRSSLSVFTLIGGLLASALTTKLL